MERVLRPVRVGSFRPAGRLEAALASLADGSRTVEELLAALAADGHPAGEALSTLVGWLDSGRLAPPAEEAAAAPRPGPVTHDALHAFAAAVGQRDAAPGAPEPGVPGRADAARVLILGDGPLPAALDESLRGLGFSPPRRAVPAAFADDGACRVAYGAEGRALDYRALVDDLAPHVVVLAPQAWDWRLADAVNATALAGGHAVLVCRPQLLTLDLGPLLLPGVTACLTCYRCRYFSTLYPPQRSAGADTPDQRGLGIPLAPGLLALELFRFIAALEPLTLAQMLRLDLLSGLAERHRVLRVPRCPACNPASPALRLWEGL